MSGAWLVSYIALWILVPGLLLLTMGLHYQLGLYRAERGLTSSWLGLPRGMVQDNGPPTGSPLREVPAGAVMRIKLRLGILEEVTADTLIVFLPRHARRVRRLVNLLETVASEGHPRTRVIAVIEDHVAANAIIGRERELLVPVIPDLDGTLARGFDVQLTPLALRYDSQGILIAKGTITGRDDLDALFGHITAVHRMKQAGRKALNWLDRSAMWLSDRLAAERDRPGPIALLVRATGGFANMVAKLGR